MPSETAFQQLIDDNIATLQAAVELVAGMDAAHYARIGGHLRHLLDHYECLLADDAPSTVNYDARGRCRQTELSPSMGLRRLQQVISRLRGAREHGDAAVDVVMATNSEAEPATTGSTRARELQFLQSHCVHHFALIRRVLVDAGVDVDDAFGKAPATLDHERRRQRASA